MASSVLRTATCRECGAGVYAEERKAECCWLCGARLESPAHDVVRRPATGRQQAPDKLGLSTLMVVVALFAVLLGVFRESPGLGILLPSW